MWKNLKKLPCSQSKVWAISRRKIQSKVALFLEERQKWIDIIRYSPVVPFLRSSFSLPFRSLMAVLVVGAHMALFRWGFLHFRFPFPRLPDFIFKWIFFCFEYKPFRISRPFRRGWDETVLRGTFPVDQFHPAVNKDQRSILTNNPCRSEHWPGQRDRPGIDSHRRPRAPPGRVLSHHCGTVYGRIRY